MLFAPPYQSLLMVPTVRIARYGAVAKSFAFPHFGTFQGCSKNKQLVIYWANARHMVSVHGWSVLLASISIFHTQGSLLFFGSQLGYTKIKIDNICPRLSTPLDYNKEEGQPAPAE